MKLSVIKFLVTLLYVLSVHINNAVFFKEQNIFKEQNTDQLCEVRCMRNVGLIYLCIYSCMGHMLTINYILFTILINQALLSGYNP